MKTDNDLVGLPNSISSSIDDRPSARPYRDLPGGGHERYPHAAERFGARPGSSAVVGLLLVCAQGAPSLRNRSPNDVLPFDLLIS